MGNVALLLDNDFEDIEALYPYYRMMEAGHKVEVVAHSRSVFHSKHNYPLHADKTPEEVKIDKLNAIIIPGGFAPDRMRTRPEMVSLVKEGFNKGLLIGAICHGAQVLIEADVLRGKRATCYISVKTDIVNAGAKYEDASVVVDGRLVTSRQPSDLPDFCRTLVSMLR